MSASSRHEEFVLHETKYNCLKVEECLSKPNHEEDSDGHLLSDSRCENGSFSNPLLNERPSTSGAVLQVRITVSVFDLFHLSPVYFSCVELICCFVILDSRRLQ